MAVDVTVARPNALETVYTWPNLTSADVTAAVQVWPARRLLMQTTRHDAKGPVTLQVSQDGTNWTSAYERTGSTTLAAGVQDDGAAPRVWDCELARYARVLCDTTDAEVVLVVRRPPEAAS
jgi:hypothetical protein